MQELEVYSMIGAEGFTRLVAAFYRQVPQSFCSVLPAWGLLCRKLLGGQ
jgi:hypothetical protein